MAGKDDSLQSISTQLDGKNYAYWSYVMKNFLRGKNMWGYVTGTKGSPMDDKAANYAALLDTWETDNSKVITWINNSVSQSIGMQLAKYDTAKEVWDHLDKLYTQSNFAKQYQLEYDIRVLQQNDMNIQDFYTAMSDLWDQLALTESAELKAFKPYITRREEQRLVQFLMALRSDFEGLRGTILHRTPLPTVDSVVHELIAEETRIKSQVDKGSKSSNAPAVFAVPSDRYRPPRPNNQNQSRLLPQVAFDECAFCKQKNHWKSQCPVLLNRMKQMGQQPKYGQQRFEPRSSGAQSFQPRPSGAPLWRPRPPQLAAAAPSVDTESVSTMPPSALDPQVFEQFRQYLASNPTAMSASMSHSGAASSSTSVQTCLLLSPRWKLVWKSVPCLSFSSGCFSTLHKFSKFVTNVLSRRNNHVEVSSVKLNYSGAASQAFVKKIANYAFSHNVQELVVISWPKNYHEYPSCLFSSTSLKHFTFSSFLIRSDLTPKIPKTPWNFPALTSLHLSDITLCEDTRENLDLFSKCVNLKNLSLNSFVVEAKVFEINTPQLSSLVLIDERGSAVINVIAPQLKNLTTSDCSIKNLDAAGLSSFVYTGYEPPKWFKGCFHSLNKVSVSLSLCETDMKYDEEDARETINMLQQLQSAKFLTLNFDIVECLSAYPDLLSHLPSPFSNLIYVKIDPDMRSDAYKINVSTEAINFLLENSPSATFIMDILEEPPTKAMIAKRAREMKRAKLIADIENCMTGLQALVEQENSVLVERKEAQDKTKVALKNIILELKVWAKKKIMGSEPEQPKEFAESREVASGLMTQFEARLTDMQDLGEQNLHGSVDILSKKGRVILLFKNLPKRQRVEMETRYACQLEEAESLSVRLHSTYEDAHNYLKKMLDGATEYISKCNSTCQDESSSKLPLASQPSSSSSAIIPASST